MDQLDELWADDRLGRRGEAALLEEILAIEAAECGRSGKNQAYVLALDAAYGEGKTFFLTKLKQQLNLKHPVAFVDAWSDDSNDEPLLAIMAAISDALEPFLTKGSQTANWLRGATAAALPIIGKIAIGAGKTFVQKYVGKEIPDEVGALLKEKSSASILEEVAIDVIDEAGGAIASLADKVGAEMLAAYRVRQKSRITFKAIVYLTKQGLGIIPNATGRRSFQG